MERVCALCGERFTPTSSKMRNRNYQGLYCSRRCANRARARPEAERFWEHVDRRGSDECWPWLAARDAHGYGLFTLATRRQRTAHRVAYELANGVTMQEGHLACHHCDNPPCCNPAHVFDGSAADNSHDRDAKGRQQRGERHHKARLTEEDVRIIRELFADGWTQTAIGEHFGVSQVNISDIVRRTAWKHVE